MFPEAPFSPTELQSLLTHVQAWIREVGQLQMTYFRQNQLTVTCKSTANDWVTQVDRLSEDLLIQRIKTLYPTHSILAEESQQANNNNNTQPSPHQWTIDPLDGTTNFVRGLPIFSISVAYTYHQVTQLGVVFAPYLDEMYSAVINQGASLNTLPLLRSSPPRSLASSLLGIGFPYDRNSVAFAFSVTVFQALVPKTAGVRRLGSAAYDLCQVARGGLDVYVEFDLHAWDIMAGALIVSEAGAQIDVTENDGLYYVVGAGSVEVFGEVQEEIMRVM
jgi:myo-inositol-1(or 4)-monophosphatase